MYRYSNIIIDVFFIDISLSFLEEVTTVDEDQGIVSICLMLSNVVEPTGSAVWVNITTVEDSAIGKLKFSGYT